MSASATSNEAIAGRYDAIAYAAQPHASTHPDRLATLATLLGLEPAPVATCRVLEVGCNDGANLIAMAVALPDARFVGCDLSPRALERGRACIAALGLSNVALVREDLCSLPEGHGSFDYLIAHGVYSWVPAPVRDGLFALARARLARHGIAYVNFNCLPGGYLRQAVWDVLHRHVDAIADPRERLAAARALAREIGAGGATANPGDEALRAEFRAVAERSDSALFHDDLALPNDPCWFDDFAAHAGRHELAYLADAEFPAMSAAGLTPEARARLGALGLAAREQYLDVYRLRRFRQALLRHAAAIPDLSHQRERIAAMHVAADPALQRAAAAGRTGELARGLAQNEAAAPRVRALLDALLAAAPAALPVATVARALDAAALGRPVETLLADALVAGILRLHVHPPAPATAVAARPLASPLARYQAATQEEVTNLLHVRVRIAERAVRQLLELCDGRRDAAALAAAMATAAFAGDRATAAAFVANALPQFATLALLCPAPLPGSTTG